MTLEKTSLALHDIIEQSVGLLADQAQQKGLEMILKLDPQVLNRFWETRFGCGKSSTTCWATPSSSPEGRNPSHGPDPQGSAGHALGSIPNQGHRDRHQGRGHGKHLRSLHAGRRLHDVNMSGPGLGHHAAADRVHAWTTACGEHSRQGVLLLVHTSLEMGRGKLTVERSTPYP